MEITRKEYFDLWKNFQEAAIYLSNKQTLDILSIITVTYTGKARCVSVVPVKRHLTFTRFLILLGKSVLSLVPNYRTSLLQWVQIILNYVVNVTCSRNITAGITDDDINNLQSINDIDPEVRPGLFQGDMALNNEVCF